MKFEFSAGGVVFKKQDNKRHILVAQHSQHHGWVFPKGLIGDKKHFKGESKETTAVREVKEETGIDAEIIQALDTIEYWYNFKGEKIKKTIYYYIMEYKGGSFKDRDHEMENVEWLPEDKVLERLTYKSDKEVWQKAREIIKRLASSI